VFANNGNGARGDLKAVVRAILIDSEARAAPGIAGKVKEPVLLMTGLARAIGFTTDGYVFVNRDTSMGQPVMRAPSVFNFYPQDYPLPGSTTLKSPASKLLNTSNVLRWHNFVYDWTIGGDATRAEYATDSGLPNSSPTQPLWSGWEAFGTDLDAMHLSRGGIPCGGLGLPLRYMHSPVEMVQLDDIANSARLVAAVAQRLTAETTFAR